MNLFKIESYRKGIAISSSFNFIAKIIAFANSIVVAYYFGTQGKTDVYLYSFATVTLISAFLTNLNGLVLIPESMRIREQEGLLNSMYFLNWFIFVFLIIGVIFSFILFLNPVKAFIFFSKFDPILLSNNISILLYVIPMLILIVLSSLLTEILVSFKYFTLPMIAGMINSIFSIAFIFIFHSSLDILSITTGLLVGFLLNVILLLILLKSQLNWKFYLKKIRISGLVFRNIFYAQAGNVSTVLGTYVPLYLISGFNQGIITALNYGRNISNIPDQLITTQFSSIFGIKLNEVYASRELSKTNEIFLRSVNMLFFILVPIGIIMSFFSTEIVTILYMRGKFDQTSVDLTSDFLRYFAITIPFLALNTLASRVITAGQKININFYIGIAMNFLFLILLFIFINIFGPIGYPIALLIYLPISTLIVNYFVFKRFFNYIKYFEVVELLLKILALNLVIGLPCFFLYRFFFSNINMLIAIPIICTIFLSILILFNNYFIINEEIIILQKKIVKMLRKIYFNRN